MKESDDPQCPKCGALIPQNAPHGLCPKCVMADVSEATQEDTRIAKAVERPDPARLAEAFPDLEIKELIGQGGMGFVYRARQSKLERDIALKVLPESLATDPAFAERFSREGRLLAKLNHPNIVTVFDFGKSESYFFLLMEYVDGLNLRQAMQAGRFTPEQALGVVPEICEALQYAHDKQVLHRDIKPENILMDADGHVKIADFGIAKMVGDATTNSGLTVSGANIGTPHYMAPEQVESSSKVDHRADIYSLGVVFYELLTGELPLGRFEAPSNRTALDTRLDEIILRALEKDRERRQQRADEIKSQVEHLTEPGTVSAGASSQPSVEPPTNRTLAPAIGLGLVALVNLMRIAPGSGQSLSASFDLSFFEALFSPIGIIMATLSGFLVYAAVVLAKREHLGVAQLGGILALVSFPWTLVGFPIGIWVLNVLHAPAVRACFPERPVRVPPKPEGNPWPRRVFWLIILLVVLPVFILITLFVAPWLAYNQAQAPRTEAPHEIVSKSQSDGVLSARIGDGHLSLLGLSSSEGASWFRPDGIPWGEEQIDGSDLRIHPGSDERAYWILIQRENLPENSSILKWDAAPPFSARAEGTPKKAGEHDESLTLIAGTLSDDVGEISLKAFVGEGDFTTIVTCSPETITGESFHHESGSHQGTPWEVTFSELHVDENSTAVTLAHDYDGGEIRVVAKHTDGSLRHPVSSVKGSQILRVTFESISMADIEQLQAQIRTTTIIEFPSIQLPTSSN